MSAKRVVLLVLVGAGVLYAVGLGLGLNQSGGVRSSKVPSWTLDLGRLFAPLTPKPKLSRSAFELAAPQSEVIDVPSSDTPFRLATFVIRRGQAEITYEDRTPGTGELRHQHFTLPDQGQKNPYKGTVVIFRKGGMMQLQCKASVSCLLELE